jgi:phage gp16-like protein
MLTGNFTAELNVHRTSQVQAEVGAHRATVRAAQTRRQTKLSRPAVVIYRKALSAVALSLLLVVGMATAALAMPQAPEVFHTAAKSSHTAAHLRNLVGPGSATDAWIAAGVFMALAVLLVVMTRLSRRRSAVA